MSVSLFNLPDCLVLSLLLVLIGSYGVFRRRSLIMILLSVEVMLNGVNLSLVSFNFFRWGATEASHYLYMLSIGVAAVEAAVGLSMIIVLFKNYNDISRDRVAQLGERA
ncbi:MAG: NADH-quinone oxidoreductase subunit [Fibrobacteres bacterium]|nr:NADH-quinone oxidoreductase subunit [Fibrobacterota bacterium]